MSFILDAIKKSEKERRLAKQNEIHSFQDEVIKTPRSKKGLFILKAILIFFLIFLSFLSIFFQQKLNLFIVIYPINILMGSKQKMLHLQNPLKTK